MKKICIVAGAKPWFEKADIALPSATQNEINEEAAKAKYDMAVNGARKEEKAMAQAQANRAKGAIAEVHSYIKENVTENTGENSGNSFKWNCFNNYQHNTNRLDGYKRWDVGGLIEGKFVYANRYAVTLGYSRGFLDKSPQFKFKNHSYHLTLGYTL